MTKAGAVRGDDASWLPAQSPAELTRAVHDNLRNLGLEQLDVVNLRLMGNVHAPSEGPLEEQSLEGRGVLQRRSALFIR